MTVKELSNLLQLCPQDAIVVDEENNEITIFDVRVYNKVNKISIGKGVLEEWQSIF